jgi:hypothetical protein
MDRGWGATYCYVVCLHVLIGRLLHATCNSLAECCMHRSWYAESGLPGIASPARARLPVCRVAYSSAYCQEHVHIGCACILRLLSSLVVDRLRIIPSFEHMPMHVSPVQCAFSALPEGHAFQFYLLVCMHVASTAYRACIVLIVFACEHISPRARARSFICRLPLLVCRYSERFEPGSQCISGSNP